MTTAQNFAVRWPKVFFSYVVAAGVGIEDTGMRLQQDTAEWVEHSLPLFVDPEGKSMKLSDFVRLEKRLGFTVLPES